MHSDRGRSGLWPEDCAACRRDRGRHGPRRLGPPRARSAGTGGVDGTGRTRPCSPAFVRATGGRWPARSLSSRTPTRGVRARPRPVSGDGQRVRGQDHGTAGCRQVEPDQRARSPPHPEPGADRRVLSVDPSSPFTQGALLGDRIRLSDHFLDPGVFIRSMGTRGHLGGLAEATPTALLVLDAAAGSRLRRDRRHGAERDRSDQRGGHDRARADAGLGRLHAGAEGRDHGDPGRDRREQEGPPAAKTMLNEVRSILGLDKERDCARRSC